MLLKISQYIRLPSTAAGQAGQAGLVGVAAPFLMDPVLNMPLDQDLAIILLLLMEAPIVLDRQRKPPIKVVVFPVAVKTQPAVFIMIPPIIAGTDVPQRGERLVIVLGVPVLQTISLAKHSLKPVIAITTGVLREQRLRIAVKIQPAVATIIDQIIAGMDVPQFKE